MTKLQDCFERGALKKIKPDMQKAKNSLLIAEQKLIEARKVFNAGIFDMALVTAYTVMFHSARALLFKDGFKERSHFCLCLYIQENYADRIESKYLNELNILREQRHHALYGNEDVVLKEVEKQEAEVSISLAAGFLSVVNRLMAQ